jgi:hypothetical protein
LHPFLLPSGNGDKDRHQGTEAQLLIEKFFRASGSELGVEKFSGPQGPEPLAAKSAVARRAPPVIIGKPEGKRKTLAWIGPRADPRP